MDPCVKGRTLRELLWMAEGKIEYSDRMKWNHTAAMMGLFHNANAKKAVGFDHYNPYVKKKSKPNTEKLDKNSIQALKALAKKGRGLKLSGQTPDPSREQGNPQP